MDKSRHTRAALAVNAVLSLTVGALLAAMPGTVGEWLGVDAPVTLRVVGIGLIVFGLGVASQAHGRLHPAAVVGISLADLAWVAGTVLLLAVFGGSFRGTGVALVIATSVVVLVLALLQLTGLDRAYASPLRPRYTHRVCVEVRAATNSDLLWRRVRDLGGIATFASQLASARLRGDNQDPRVGAVRECIDRKGACWAERCDTLDDAERVVEMEFLADEPGFPFPVRRMRGGWSVQSAHDGSRVRVWWDLTPRARVLSPLLVPLMELQAGRLAAQTVAAMADDAAGALPTSGEGRPRLIAVSC